MQWPDVDGVHALSHSHCYLNIIRKPDPDTLPDRCIHEPSALALCAAGNRELVTRTQFWLRRSTFGSGSIFLLLHLVAWDLSQQTAAMTLDNNLFASLLTAPNYVANTAAGRPLLKFDQSSSKPLRSKVCTILFCGCCLLFGIVVYLFIHWLIHFSLLKS